MVSTVCERIAAAFRNCDNFELETCERRLEEHLRVLAAVSVSRSISSALSSQSRGIFGDLIDGVVILLNSISTLLLKTVRCRRNFFFQQFFFKNNLKEKKRTSEQHMEYVVTFYFS